MLGEIHTKKFIDSFYFDKTNGKDNYESLSDIQIVCGDDNDRQSFSCHKLMLSLGSSVFKEMLENCTASSKEENEVLVTEDPKTMKSLLNFMYTGNVEQDMIGPKLFVAADKYDLKHLQDICEEGIIKHISLNNVIQTAIKTHQYGSTDYQQKLLEFILKNWTELQKTTDFRQIAECPDLSMKIMSFSITHEM